MSKNNRDKLFVEVDQEDLKSNIFIPIYNLDKSGSYFFGKRFAILGDFKIGKTELGKFINFKMEDYYEDCICITINSQMVQYLNVKEIHLWVYEQWLLKLMQVNNPDLENIVKKVSNKFIQDRGQSIQNISNELDKIFLISEIYKNYLKIKPEAKFVVEFDQANIITDEDQFTPFYEFWRYFQGFWEDDNYFSEIPLFIFVIGHKNWINFATLKNPSGRGVFDKYISYNYWNTTDIHELFKKRLNYAIKNEYKKELMEYFLCPGIIDFFGKKLGEVSTQEYLDEFFDDYLQKFIKDYENNKSKYKDFLDFCRKDIRKKKYDNTYFDDVERIFTGTPALDYMPVFRFISQNQDKKWFDELFLLIEDIYDKHSISFDSKGLKNYKNLTHQFIYYNFALSALSNKKPKYNPPLFHDYEGKLALDSAFSRCLDAIPHGLQGPVSRLKRFVKSERISRIIFNKDLNDKEMRISLRNLIQISDEIFAIIQKWYINEYLGIISSNEKMNSNNLIPFDKIRKTIFKLNDLYKGKLTNWAIFDKEARIITPLLMGKYFPKNSIFISQLNLKKLEQLKNNIDSPKTSNITIVQATFEILNEYLSQINDFNEKLIKKNQIIDNSSQITTEDQILKELINKVKKYKDKELELSDFKIFLDQIKEFVKNPSDYSEIREQMVKLLKRIKNYYFTFEQMAKILNNKIEEVVPEQGYYFVILDDSWNHSNLFWTYYMDKMVKINGYKSKIYKSTELIEKLKEINIDENNEKCLIFIDDLIGTGNSFIKSYKKYFEKDFEIIEENKKRNVKIYLIAGVGSIESMEKISNQTLVNKDRIRYSKIIKKKDKAFYKTHWSDTIKLNKFKNFLIKLDNENWNGYGNQEFLVVFEWSVPNNTISCLWKDNIKIKNKKWKPLFPRN